MFVHSYSTVVPKLVLLVAPWLMVNPIAVAPSFKTSNELENRKKS